MKKYPRLFVQTNVSKRPLLYSEMYSASKIIICVYSVFIELKQVFTDDKYLSSIHPSPNKLRQRCTAICYFPLEFQGEYKMQTVSNLYGNVQYSTLNITATSIPIWGNCHERRGSNFVLILDYGVNKCIRCLHLKMRSKNIMQVFTTGQETISKCYVNEESAINNCPTTEFVQNSLNSEILLFKTKDAAGTSTRTEYCPLDGKFSVNYKSVDKNYTLECKENESTLDSCPFGSHLNFRFRQCNVNDFDVSFECLGHWKGPNGENYLALTDKRQTNNPKAVQYKCALYTRNELEGTINMQFRKDSACPTPTKSDNSDFIYEHLSLKPLIEDNWPPEVSYGQCNFPQWMGGTWEHVKIFDNTLVYKDRSTFKTFTIKCMGVLDDDDNKYLIFSRNQCGEEQYNCMKIQKRSDNIMELQLGKTFSKTIDAYGLCNSDNFEEGAWITQGRVDEKVDVACPISGEYTGLIPNTDDLCAKLWSDCRVPDVMYYQVSSCETNEIYEEREYTCLGHWQENNLLYTYTQRKDVSDGSYECFVGSIMNNKETISIREAGEDCRRSVDQEIYEMKLKKQGLYSCIGNTSCTGCLFCIFSMKVTTVGTRRGGRLIVTSKFHARKYF
ncbi:uncharacterized protein LOC108738245 isoform X1 [Agrilus planipennis]|uniref:Uncharacterized protein LOC108738245 isoform X1 n=1 Tax=Agrilus planipennis TaxID=224129 RepID=A0A7F5RFF7_AGRPL|nr:uncharacterized protein LOC108738245 isoform X1 [Agrilus planipennis]